MPTLPPSLNKFFWDVDPKAVDIDKNYFFVLERLLEEGDDAAIRWVMSYYGDGQRLEVVRNSRRLSRKTARLWQNYYGLGEEEVRCLSTSSRETGNPYWTS
ncbi:MAG: hypothetical protein AB1700_15215 [Bacillota bacterium]